MSEFIITLLFGWLGVHKFIQKKYGLGILYFFTLGLFGIGWLIDTITAFMRMTNGNYQISGIVSSGDVRSSSKQLIKSFDTVIVGTFANCDLDPESKREDLIFCVKPNWELSLKYWEYKGEPAYYVTHPNGADLGNVRAGLAKILHDEYGDCEFKVIAIKRGYDNKNNCSTYNIRIDIYR